MGAQASIQCISSPTNSVQTGCELTQLHVRDLPRPPQLRWAALCPAQRTERGHAAHAGADRGGPDLQGRGRGGAVPSSLRGEVEPCRRLGGCNFCTVREHAPEPPSRTGAQDGTKEETPKLSLDSHRERSNVRSHFPVPCRFALKCAPRLPQVRAPRIETDGAAELCSAVRRRYIVTADDVADDRARCRGAAGAKLHRAGELRRRAASDLGSIALPHWGLDRHRRDLYCQAGRWRVIDFNAEGGAPFALRSQIAVTLLYLAAETVLDIY